MNDFRSPLRPDANAGRDALVTGGGSGTTIVVDGGADAWGIGEPPPAAELT